MKLIFRVSLLFISCYTAIAQNSISGNIVDTKNNPLIGVEIYAAELHKGTVTDINGNYTLKNLPNGKVKITFSYLGYQTQNKVIEFTSKNQQLNITLQESVFTIDEVIISTPFNKLQSENVMKVERLTAASLKKTGAPTLIAGLEKIAGVSQIATGTSIGKPVIRGLSGNRVLVYAQGVRLENQQFGDEHGLGLNDEGIESAEVIKGPASLLYGSDALGGVLYLNPEKFALTNNTKTTFSQKLFSNTYGSNTSIGYKTSSDTWKFLTRVSRNYHADYKTPNNKRITNTRFRENDFKVGLGYNSAKYSNELRYNFNQSKLGITEGIEAQNKYTIPLEPYQQINNHILSLHNHFYFENSKLDIDLGYIYNDRSEFEEHHDEHHDDDDDDDHEEEHEEEHEEGAALQMKLKTFNYNVKYHLPSNNDGIERILGIQGMSQTNTNLGEEILIPNAKINDLGVFYTLNKQWDTSSIQGGIRFDTRSLNTEKHLVAHEDEVHVFNPLQKDYLSFTASLGYKFELIKSVTTRLNVASGFRAPNLAELASNGVHHGTNRFEIGNPDLDTEKNIQFDVSLEYKTDHIELFGNAFYNKLNDYIYLSPTGEVEDGAPVFNYIQNNAKLYGGEFGFHLHPHPIDWLHLESSFEMVIGKQHNGAYLPLIPANTFKNTLRTEFEVNDWLKNGYTNITVTSTMKQSNVSSFETTTNGYNLVSIGLGGDIKFKSVRFSTSFSVTNLFDTKYIHHLSRLKSDNLLNAGRNIVLGLNFTL
jgi:iron complex outermembrane receptor protein